MKGGWLKIRRSVVRIRIEDSVGLFGLLFAFLLAPLNAVEPGL
jgi:hypothetical protein